MPTFVSVGNARQPFPRLLGAVAGIAKTLPQPVVVQHGETPFACSTCVAIPYLEMDQFAQHVVEAELLIFHGGAGAILHAVTAGRVPVIMPRRACHGEHLDDHQLEFTKTLAESGKVVIAENAKELGRVITERLHVQQHYIAARGEPRMVSLIREALAELDKDYGQ